MHCIGEKGISQNLETCKKLVRGCYNLHSIFFIIYLIITTAHLSYSFIET